MRKLMFFIALILCVLPGFASNGSTAVIAGGAATAATGQQAGTGGDAASGGGSAAATATPAAADKAARGAAVPTIPGIAAALEWNNAPEDWKWSGGTLSITAGKGTNWFTSPMDPYRIENSPKLSFPAASDFVLQAKVTVPFVSQWDAGVLFVSANENLWAKLCFERSTEGVPTIVSVVTRGLSDDVNHFPVHGNTMYLKIAKSGHALAFYASEDGKKWSTVRVFTLGPDVVLSAGLSAQSPAGERVTATFEEIRYEARSVNLWAEE